MRGEEDLDEQALIAAHAKSFDARGWSGLAQTTREFRPEAERVLVSCWAETMLVHYGADKFTVESGPHPNEAPDCIVNFFSSESQTSKKITVEYAELVREETIEAKKWGKPYESGWTEGQIVEKVQEIIGKKTEIYARNNQLHDVLLIGTDEHELYREIIDATLPSHRFNWGRVFNEVHVMKSYDPRTHNWPVWILKKTAT